MRLFSAPAGRERVGSCLPPPCLRAFGGGEHGCDGEGSAEGGATVKTAKRKKAGKAETKLAGLAAYGLPNDLIPDLNVEFRAISSLTPSPTRTRKTTTEQLTRVVTSLKHHGCVKPILVRGDVIVDGHVVAEAMTKLGEAEVPAIDLKHLSEPRARTLALALNRTAETGTWDLDALRIEFAALDGLNLDLEATGFTLPEIDLILLEDEEEEEVEEEPEPGPPVSQLGDIWLMGPHRLLNADSTKPESYTKLMGDEKATVMFTDPPYNVAIAGNVSGLGKVKHGEFVQGSGEMTKPEFGGFLSSFLGAARSYMIERGVAFVFMDWRHDAALQAAGESVGFTLVNKAVWDKGTGGMGALYRSQHELVLVFCNGKTPAINNVMLGSNGRDRTNVWTFPGATAKGSDAAKTLKDHPTPKPVALVVEALLDVSHKSDIVLDPFIGSGTTIIAAEECGRIARGIELDPRYVDVAVRRWQTRFEAEAILKATGETFDVVQARRSAEIEPETDTVATG